MNILHVINNADLRTGGGSARVPIALAKEQRALGHKVAINTDVDSAIQKMKPDIMHMHNYRTMTNLAHSINGVPFVLQALGSALPIPKPRHWYTLPWKPTNDAVWRRMLINKSKRLLACTEQEVDQYVAEGADRNKCVVMPLGIDADEYSNLPERNHRKWRTVLWFGRYHYYKAPDVMVRAFAHVVENMPDVRLVMAGWDDGAMQATHQLIYDLGFEEKVIFYGYVDGQAKLQLYADADVHVVPSRYEAYGLTIFEACACGTPVIITDRCAIAKELPGYCGAVVPWGIVTIAQAIKHELDNTLMHKKQRIAWGLKHNWHDIAIAMVELYKQVINDSVRRY